jgi:pimeloyl-ACP methyl ester carboxylesterase
MTIHEFGKENEEIILLIHPSAVMWDYFEYVVPLLEKDYHIVIPALPGYDEDELGDFTSVEEIATELAGWLKAQGHTSLELVYGCSMGGSIALRMLADRKIDIQNAVIDGGITPYQLPRVFTVFIALRDFLMVCMGKWGGRKLLMKAFSADAYSDKDLKYVEKVLRFMSYKTIWRTFDSCNNYNMPNPVPQPEGHVEYWYADAEEKARAWDIAYIKKKFQNVHFVKLEHIGHGGMASTQPRKMADRLTNLLKQQGPDEQSEQDGGKR